MSEALIHPVSDWKDRQNLLSNRSAEEILFDEVGCAIINYKEKLKKENDNLKKVIEEKDNYIEYLHKILEENGIPLSRINGKQVFIPHNKPKKKKITFRQLIQGDNAEDTIQRLHKCIDNKGGKDVAAVLLRAKADSLISRLPKEKEFMPEFPDITTKWRAISTYLNPNNLADYSSVII